MVYTRVSIIQCNGEEETRISGKEETSSRKTKMEKLRLQQVQ